MGNNYTGTVEIVKAKQALKKPGLKGFFVICLLLFFIISISNKLSASTATDFFRSKATGSWATTGTWESSPDGITWSAATLTPSSAANTIILRSPYTVTMAANITADQIIVNSGATLTLTAILTLNDGTATDLSVDGILQKSGNTADIVISAGANIAINAGAKYTHIRGGSVVSGNTIPTATWSTTSTCEIQLTGTTVCTGLGQSFGNFTWNSTSQGGNINLAGVLTTVNGNLTLTSFGGYYLYINGTASTSSTLTIGGNFVYNSTSGLDYLYLKDNTGTQTINVNGSMTLSHAGYFYGNNAGGTLNLNVAATFMDVSTNYTYYNNGAGTLNMVVTGSATIAPTTASLGNYMNVAGGAFNLTVHTNLTFSNAYDLYVNNAGGTATIVVDGYLSVASGGSSTTYFNYGTGTLNISTGGAVTIAPLSSTFNTYLNYGTGTLTMNVGTDLTFNNGYYVYVNGGGTGGPVTITVPGNMVVAPTASYVYFNNGSASASKTNITVTGNTILTAPGARTISLNSNSNAGGTSTFNLNGNLTVNAAGAIDFGGNTAIATVNLNGNFTKTSGSMTTVGSTTNGIINFVGTSATQTIANNAANTYINYFVTAGSVVAFSGTSTAYPLGGNSIFTVSNGGTLICGTNYLSVAGAFTLNSGGIIKIGSTGGIATTGATGNIQSTGTRTFNSGATYEYNGTAAQVTGVVTYSTAGTITGALTINNSSGNVTLSQATAVNGGAFTLQGSKNLITTASNLLTLNASATSGRTGIGYVDGPLARTFTAGQAKVFDVGNSTAGGYGGLTLTPVAAATYTATVVSGDHADVTASGCIAGISGSASVNTYWTIKNSSVTGTTATAGFNYAALSQETMSAPTVKQNTTVTGIAANWTSASPSSPSSAGISLAGSASTGVYVIGDIGLTPTAATITPASQSVCSGATVTLTASGVTPSSTSYTYQWYKGTYPSGVAVSNGSLTGGATASGATSITLTITNAQATYDNGAYYLLVTGCGGSINSNSSSLTINAGPTNSYTLSATSNTICPGASTTISLSGSQSGASYQLRDASNTNIGSPVSGTSLGISFAPVSPTTTTTYNVYITNAAPCSVPLASTITITVNTAVSISTQPSNVTTCPGTASAFSIAASGTSATYQWQRSTDGVTFVNIVNSVTDNTYTTYSGATTSSLTFTPNAVGGSNMDGYQYKCIVSVPGTGCGSVTSNAATLTVGGTVTWTGGGNDGSWLTATNWSTGLVPGACAKIIIPTAPAVNATSFPNITFAAPGAALDITIQAGANVLISAGGTLSTTGNMIVSGTLTNNGAWNMVTAGNFTITGGTYVHNPATNNAANATMFTSGTESFDATSTLDIKKWYDYTIPLAQNITGNFGNILFETGNANSWDQKGYFRSQPIAGTLTIADATVILDNSTTAGTTTVTAGTTTIGAIVVNNVNAVLDLVSPTLTTFGNYNVTTTFSITNGITISAGVLNGLSLYNTLVTNTIAGSVAVSANSLIMTGGTFQGTQPVTIVGGATAATTNFNFTFTGLSPVINLSGAGILYGITSSVVPYSGNFTLSGSPALAMAGTSLFDGVYAGTVTTASASAITLGAINMSGGSLFNGTDGAISGSSSITSTTVALSGTAVMSVAKGYSNAANTSIATLTSSAINIAGGNLIIQTGYATGAGTINVSGNLSLSNGVFTVRKDQGTSTMAVSGNYNQSGGTFNMYNYTSLANNSNITVNINGDFTQSNGTFSFDDNATGTALSRILNISGANYTISGGTISRSGTTVFGQLNFTRIGTMSYVRAGGHSLQGVRQTINAGCTLDVSGSASDMQIGSNALADLTQLTVSASGTLKLGAQKVYSNASAANSGITVNGTVQLGNVYGLYDNSTNAAFSNAGALNFTLAATSTIVYNGSVSQVLTGNGVGGVSTATGTQYKYGNLIINNTGTCVYPASGKGNPIVRTQLALNAGVLNLNGTPGYGTLSTSGRTILIENTAATAITASPGSFISSETSDQSGKVRWNMAGVTGDHVFPFGFSPAAGDYIPFTFSPTAGTVDTVSLATYRTNKFIQPFPPGVTDINDSTTAHKNDSDYVVHRFWQINKTGSNGTANITFSYTGDEVPNKGDADMKAQRWGGNGWQSWYTVGSSYSNINTASTGSAGTVTVNGVSNFSPWTLVNKLHPLPVELLSFKAVLVNNKVNIGWITASEINNNYFAVERSRNLTDFEPVYRTPGLGNSSVLTTYNAIDENPLPGISYYRLKQVDFNGQFSFSKLSSVNKIISSAFTASAFADFDNSIINVKFTSETESNYIVRIFDALGKLYIDQKGQSLKGGNSIDLNVAGLSRGIYFISINNAENSITKKVVY